MTKRIPKRIREEAAMLCAIAASSTRGHGITSAFNAIRGTDHGVMTIIDDPAYRLASKAFVASFDRPQCLTSNGMQDWPAQMAEAEALLRCGWSPNEDD